MRKTYGSGLLIFHTFCNSQNIAEADWAPAHSDLVASFIAALAGQYSNKTIWNYIYGIRAWHILHGLEWRMNEPEILAPYIQDKPALHAAFIHFTSRKEAPAVFQPS
ncbi:hypothetical protein SERLA73DRAFT_72058 [Serpula lacrymans var. lacrymans S7.3]|uniref:Integrase SAM-like N-terminal domain-containing protein n=2 Tax=Serpula lacrymans var. lacrymans TaxID=341189 RepID=F8PTU3_SERL3|nr:uncharacterized protein SERLADRAFT_436566 [Serpula lacrymans var. lacrymans S7.9]EGO01088.1 hypothetical protein SERLA73DRAFT_72058 [Serpula lacrymans var. lacrymans S7.3]EGO26746.1 hypothetical protein SERLADRAFT_436566 [Serpula lacrymans var. lacrymans S7.9]